MSNKPDEILGFLNGKQQQIAIALQSLQKSQQTKTTNYLQLVGQLDLIMEILERFQKSPDREANQ